LNGVEYINGSVQVNDDVQMVNETAGSNNSQYFEDPEQSYSRSKKNIMNMINNSGSDSKSKKKKK
jgi:hypothetical protein